MMLRGENRMVFWPAYIDKKKTRSEGRIIPRRLGVADPTLDELEEAAIVLGLSPEVEVDKAYPRSWWEESGRILIETSDSKSQVARKIAEIIRGKRGES